MTDSLDGPLHARGTVEHPPARPDRSVPRIVKWAFTLMMLNVVIGAVAALVVYATRDQVKKDILMQSPKLSASSIDTTLTIATFTDVVILLLLLFLAPKVRAGVNWARTATWVIAGFGALSLLLTFTQTTSATNHTFSVITGLINLAIIVLLARRESNQYFRR